MWSVFGSALGGLPCAVASAAKVAVLPPKVESDTAVSEGRRSKFHDSFVQGLRDAAVAGTDVLAADAVRSALEGSPELTLCVEGSCIGQAAQKLAADRIVVPRLQMKDSVGGSSYRISLSVYDRSGAPLPVTGSETCGDDSEGCNLAKAFAAMRRSTLVIAERVGAPLPAPAQAVITPPPKVEPVVPEKPPEPPTSLQDPLLPPQPVVKPYNKAYRWAWIGSAAAGGALLVSSIPFLVFAAKENDITCAAGTPRNQCETIYSGNLTPGAILLTGGLVGAGLFGVFYYLDYREQRRAMGATSGKKLSLRPSLELSPQRASFALEGRF